MYTFLQHDLPANHKNVLTYNMKPQEANTDKRQIYTELDNEKKSKVNMTSENTFSTNK